MSQHSGPMSTGGSADNGRTGATPLGGLLDVFQMRQYFNLLVGGQGKNLSRCLFIVLGFAWAGWRAVQGVRREEGCSTALASCK